MTDQQSDPSSKTVEIIDKSVDEALAEAKRKAAAVMAQLTDDGVPESLISTERMDAIQEAMDDAIEEALAVKADVTSLTPRHAPPKRWLRSTETYGKWLRTAPSEQLTRAERTFLRNERRWEAENPKHVALLMGMVGSLVRLRSTNIGGPRVTWASDVKDHVPYTRGLPKAYQAGMLFRIIERVGDRLLGRAMDGVIIQLRLAWISPIVGEDLDKEVGSN